MKKFWFKRKMYGWEWTFGTRESFLVMALYVAFNVFIFVSVDSHSHSGSDTLINFAPRFLLLTVVLYFICWWKWEKPRWQPIRQAQGKWGEGVAEILTRGGVVVMLTDTTYGIIGSALNEKTVNEIYRLRKRDLNKPFIVLIADKKDLKKFGVMPTEAQEKILRRVWSYNASRSDKPKPTSVILPCTDEKFAYLHRGGNTLAFRLPAKAALRRLLRATGPLVAPSANPQGHPVARTIAEARAYFGNQVNFYQDGGAATAPPSRLIDITDGTEKVLR